MEIHGARDASCFFCTRFTAPSLGGRPSEEEKGPQFTPGGVDLSWAHTRHRFPSSQHRDWSPTSSQQGVYITKGGWWKNIIGLQPTNSSQHWCIGFALPVTSPLSAWRSGNGCRCAKVVTRKHFCYFRKVWWLLFHLAWHLGLSLSLSVSLPLHSLLSLSHSLCLVTKWDCALAWLLKSFLYKEYVSATLTWEFLLGSPRLLLLYHLWSHRSHVEKGRNVFSLLFFFFPFISQNTFFFHFSWNLQNLKTFKRWAC